MTLPSCSHDPKDQASLTGSGVSRAAASLTGSGSSRAAASLTGSASLLSALDCFTTTLAAVVLNVVNSTDNVISSGNNVVYTAA